MFWLPPNRLEDGMIDVDDELKTGANCTRACHSREQGLARHEHSQSSAGTMVI